MNFRIERLSSTQNCTFNMKLLKIIIGSTALSSAFITAKSKAEKKPISVHKDELELRHVQVVFRHGARTPLHIPSYIKGVSYEESLLDHAARTIIPYKIVPLHGRDLNESPFEKSYKKRGKLEGGCYPGQLTKVGAEQMYDLGLILKIRYVDTGFLSQSSKDRAGQIFVRSTNIERTILSARSLLAGMFCDKPVEEAISIHVSSPRDEILYPNYYSCKYFASLTQWAFHDPDALPGIREIRQSVQRALGVPEDEKLHLVDVYDNLKAGVTHGKSPLALNRRLLDQAEQGALRIMQGAFVGVDSVRQSSLKLAIGSFVDLLLNNIEQKCSEQCSQSGVKLHLFSGHDTTLIPLLNALNIKESHWPPYAANVMLELYQSRSKSDPAHFVQVLYNGQEQRIPGCSETMCPLGEFQKAVSGVRISMDEYGEMCKRDSKDTRTHVPGM